MHIIIVIIAIIINHIINQFNYLLIIGVFIILPIAQRDISIWL